jgi:hypothetical protein
MRKQIVILLFVLFPAIGCDTFSTRSPEEPDSGKSTFVPPSSPQIVVDNFKYAITEKNLENYLQCFPDAGDEAGYFYEPTADVLALYPSLFDNWDISDEQIYFNSLLSSIPEEYLPLLEFDNPEFTTGSPDSTIFSSEYELIVQENSENPSNIYRGFLYFTIVPGSDGLWFIRRWTDSSPAQSDSASSTWSNLKAKYF